MYAFYTHGIFNIPKIFNLHDVVCTISNEILPSSGVKVYHVANKHVYMHVVFVVC